MANGWETLTIEDSPNSGDGYIVEFNDGKKYWHIELDQDDGTLRTKLSKVREKIVLTPYKVEY